MKKNVCFSAVMAGMLSLAFAAAPALADDAAKLKELEHAMSAPASAPQHHKGRTRSIVFDNADEAAPAQQAQSESKPAQAAASCGNIAPDAPMTAVDFAINFKSGSAQISPASERTLEQIAKLLSLSDKCVVVEGHTDAIGNADKNMALSKDRAESVVNFVVEKSGIDRNRLVPVGKGSTDPIKNLNPRNPQNRRVVFKVVG